MSEAWLPTLKTETPEAGYQLAIKLARMGVKAVQGDDDVRSALRVQYERDADALIAASHVIAVHFNTIGFANNWWRK